MFITRRLPYLLSRFTPKCSSFYIRPLSSDINLKTSDDRIHLTKNNVQYDYPHVWLRDNCQCEKCFHSKTKSRMIDWKYFDITAKPTNVSLNNEAVEVVWNDGHTSSFPLNWLKERSFNEADRRKYTYEVYRPERIPWNKENIQTVFKKHDYNDVMNNNDSLKAWLQSLNKYGVSLITNVPKQEDSCRKLANRVEFPKRTHYGEEFKIQAKPDTTSYAYLSVGLQIHTDSPYYEYKPGVNLLHFYIQTNEQGGENLFTDGLHVVKKFKENYKENYEILKEVEVDWIDMGEENGNKFHSLYRSPVICENKNGEITRINYSTTQRGSHFNVPIDKVKPWYESLRLFVDMVHEESIPYKVNEGDILTFDNLRLLHGRTQYYDSGKNIRCLIGMYLDWDYIKSRMRVLDEKSN